MKKPEYVGICACTSYNPNIAVPVAMWCSTVSFIACGCSWIAVIA